MTFQISFHCFSSDSLEFFACGLEFLQGTLLQCFIRCFALRFVIKTYDYGQDFGSTSMQR